MYRPVPLHLKGLRRTARYRGYARFYAIYESMTGKTKRASWVVRISPSMSNRNLYKLMVSTCNNILDNKIPKHFRGQVFESFSELYRTPWIRVRRIKTYKAGIVYER